MNGMRKKINVAGKVIADFTRPFLVAECGINHNGSMALAKKMILAARDNGADAVKFQFFRNGHLINPYLAESNDIIKILSKVGLTAEQVRELKLFSDKAGIIFFATAFDPETVDVLDRLDVPLIKIASGDINNFMLLEKAARTKRPVIFSTGASTKSEVRTAFEFMRKWDDSLCVLHCVSMYPALPQQMQLQNIMDLRKQLGVPAGLSDHTAGLDACYASAAIGAAVIEKHFTLSRGMKGPDQKLSTEPAELKKIRETIDMISLMFDKNERKPLRQEIKGNYWGRRSLVAARNIGKGTRFGDENVSALRPVKGLPASAWIDIKGRKAKRDIREGSFIRKGDF